MPRLGQTRRGRCEESRSLLGQSANVTVLDAPHKGGEDGLRGPPIVAEILNSEYELVKTVLNDAPAHGVCVQESGVVAM